MSALEALGIGLAIGLANAAHCAGMCGLFAVRAAAARAGGRTLFGLLCYTSGKAFTYVFIGSLAGALGATILETTRWSQAALGLLVAAALVLAAWRLLRGAAGAGVAGGAFARFLAPLLGRLPRADTPAGSFALGMVTGAIPCGVVYLGALEGATSGSPFLGGLLMAALGLGTIPVLLLAGVVGGRVADRMHARRIRLVAAGIVLVLAAFTLVRAVHPLVQEAGSGLSTCCH